jgi:hypothetical protein
MDQRQEDRIVAELESIKYNTDLLHRIQSQEEFLRRIAEDVSTIRHFLLFVASWSLIAFVFKYFWT